MGGRVSDLAPRLLLISFTPFPAPTGEATRVAQRILSFSDAGYALDVLTPKTAQLPHVSKLANARILRVPMPHLREGPERRTDLDEQYAAFERALRRQLDVNDYDAIHTFDPFTAPTVLELKGLARVGYEATEGLPSDEGDVALGAQFAQGERELADGADICIVPSERVARRIRALGARAEQVHVLPPSAATALFAPPALGRSERPSVVGVALTAGKLHSGEAMFLNRALGLLPATPALAFTISAEVSNADALVLEARDNVHVTRPTLFEELVDLYQSAGIGLVVSPSEKSPVRLQPLVEMMASGLAIIAPDVEAVRALVTPGVEALLVPPGNAVRLAEALVLLGGNASLRARLGATARQRAERDFDDRRVGSLLLSLYASTISESVSLSPCAFLESSGPALPSAISSSSRATQLVPLAALLKALGGASAETADADDITRQSPVFEAFTLPDAPVPRPRAQRPGDDDLTQSAATTEPALRPVRLGPTTI